MGLCLGKEKAGAVPSPAAAEKAQAQAASTSHVNEIVAGKVSKALEAAVAKEKQEEVSTS